MKSALAALLGLATLAAPVLAQDLPDLAGREVVIVTENAYPPLQFLDASGAAVGWEYDAMAEIAKRLNITVTYENISWDAMIPAVSEGQFDMGMTGITIRDDRKEQVDFSDSYMTSQMVMMVRGTRRGSPNAASRSGRSGTADGSPAGDNAVLCRGYECWMATRPTRGSSVRDLWRDGEALKAGDVDLVLPMARQVRLCRGSAGGEDRGRKLGTRISASFSRRAAIWSRYERGDCQHEGGWHHRRTEQEVVS